MSNGCFGRDGADPEHDPGRSARGGGTRRAGAGRRPGSDPVRLRRRRRRTRPDPHRAVLRRDPHPGRRRPRRPAGVPRRPAGRGDGALPPGRRRRRAGVQPAQCPHRDGHGAGRRDGDPGRHPAPATGRAAHAERGQGGRDRVRPGRQGAGRVMVTRLLRLAARPAPADAADALALAICHIWRGVRAGGPDRRRPLRCRGDRQRPRTGRRPRPRRRGRRGRRRRADGAVRTRDARPAAGRAERPALDQPGRAGGLAHPLRLRRRRRAVPVRAAADRERGRPAAGPGGARRALAAGRPPRRRHRGPGRAHARCRESARRARSGWSSS